MLTEKQKGVLRGMASAVVVALISFTVAIWMGGERFEAFGMSGNRLRLVALSDLPLLLLFAINIGILAQHRFFTPADIDGSGLTAGTPRARQLQAILQNTMEQLVLAVLAHLFFALFAPASWLVLVPVAAALFLIGRVFFWRGYAEGAPARAFGFALTFYPSVLMGVAATIFALAGS